MRRGLPEEPGCEGVPGGCSSGRPHLQGPSREKASGAGRDWAGRGEGAPAEATGAARLGFLAPGSV